MTAYKIGDRVRSIRGQRTGGVGTVVEVVNVKGIDGDGHYRVRFDDDAKKGTRAAFKFGSYMEHFAEPKKKEFGVFFWRTTKPRPKQYFSYNAVYKQIKGKMALAGYVRCEVVKAVDLSEALCMGTKRKGETLMNSHKIRK